VLRERGVGEEVEAALALFASFVMEPEQVRQIVRWDMAVLKESPWYRQILEEGLQEGRRLGCRRASSRASSRAFSRAFSRASSRASNRDYNKGSGRGC